MSADFMAQLMARDWPGNAHALMSAAMRFALGLTQPTGCWWRIWVDRTDGPNREVAVGSSVAKN